MEVQLYKTVSSAVSPTPRVLDVAAMFGLGIDTTRELTLLPATSLSLHAHQLIFVTGASGSGKSTLLNLIDDALQDQPADVIRFDQMPQPTDAPLVDALADAYALDLKTTLGHLSAAGLNDAFVMLRKPSELSDGQRYRFALAQVMARVGSHVSPKDASRNTLPVVLADEFGATLDRQTAAIVARNIRRFVDKTPVCFIAATTHDDLLEALRPDVLIDKALGETVHVLTRDQAACP